MSGREGRSLVVRYYLWSFLGGCHFFSAVLVPFFTVWGGVSLMTAQTLQSWFTFCVFALEVPTGALADRIGRKKSLVLGSGVAVVAALVYGSYPSIVLFAVGELLFALAIALTSGADKALLYDGLVSAGREADAGKVFGRARAFHLVGIAVSAPIGSLVASGWGLNAPMLLWAAAALVTAMVAWTLPESRQAKEGRVGMWMLMKESVVVFRRNLMLVRLTMNASLVASAAYFVIWLYQPVMMGLGVSVGWFGWAHVLLVAAQVAVAASFGQMSKWLGGTRRYLGLSALVTAVGFFAVGFWPSLVTLVLFVVLSGGFGLTRMEFILADVNREIESEGRATALSCVSMINRLMLAVLNPMVGFGADRSLSLALLLVGCLPLLSLAFLVKRREAK